MFGIKKIWGGTKNFFSKSGESLSKLGIVSTISNFLFECRKSDVDERFNKTSKFRLFKEDLTLYFKDKELIIPNFIDRNQRPFEKSKALYLALNGMEYKLEPVRHSDGKGDHVEDQYGNKLYEILKLRDGLKEPNKFRETKAYAVWLDNNGDIANASVNSPGIVKYDFSGEISSYKLTDRDPRTKQTNYLTSLVTVPIGVSSYLLKLCGYKIPDAIFNTVPRILNRVIVPLVSLAVFTPIFIIGKPLSLLSEKSKEDFSNLYSKIWDFNKSILTRGFTNYLRENILDQSTIEEQLKAIKDGSIQGASSSTIYAKKACLDVLNGFSHVMNGANILISNTSNILASWLKAIGNTFLGIVHFDTRYLQAAKFLFTEPIKIFADEFSEEFKLDKTGKIGKMDEMGKSSRQVSPTAGNSGMSQSDLQEVASTGRKLSEAGVTHEDGTISFSDNVTPGSGINRNPACMPSF